ncbi:MAG: PTS system mannose/fructose/sorbose family transporter subunit IID [Deltaproteobacteria bacterium]|nr:PTS system mannose/fructose/sorbose family transporter subunit IID [Deltaproteobacteria bacterium]
MSSRGALGEDAASRFKKKVMAPYGAVGDGFFWGSLRPMASCAGAATALVWGMWGPLVFLVIYNIFHLWMRWNGLKMGLELGEGVAGYIKSLNLTEWGIRAKYSALAFTGAITALTAVKTLSYVPLTEAARSRASWLAVLSALFILCVILLNEFFKRGIRVERLIYLFIPPLILYAVISF